MAAEAAQLLDLFRRNAKRELLTDARTEERVTYGEVLDHSLRLASLFQERGVRPGDSIVFSMENCRELVALYFATLHAGARIVPINPAYHPKDYATIVSRVRPKLVVLSASVRARVGELPEQDPASILCLRPQVEPVKAAWTSLENLNLSAELARLAPSERTFAAASDDDVLAVMFTSGTTGVPKGIQIRYGGLLGNGRAFGRRLGLNAQDRFYNILSMSYLGGLYNLMLIPILAEGSYVLDAPFGPANMYGFWEQVRDRAMTVLWFSPTILSMLLALEDDTDLSFLRSQVRFGICGMAPLPVDLKRRFEARFGITLYENYGLSETTFVTTTAPGLPAKSGSVGRNVEGVRVQIVDTQFKPVDVGQEGQIVAYTPYLMAGYDNPGPAELATLVPGGGFITGDVGYLDRDGDLFITGRLKDIIIRGGVNISPKAIEDAVYQLESVQEVAVVGTPHPVYGEEVALVVRVRDSHRDRLTAEDLRRFCEANVAHFQRPKHIFLIDEMPKGVTGKIQKAALRRILIDRLDALAG